MIFINKTKKEKGLIAISLYALISIIGIILYNNHFITGNYIRKYFYTLLTAIEFCFFGFFIGVNVTSKKAKNIILVSSAGFLLFITAYSISTPIKIDSVSIGVETIFILTFSSYFLYERINDPKTLFIYNDYRFWIVMAFMLYLAGAFFIYIFANQIPKSELRRYWMFTYVFYIIKNILFSIGILIYALQRPNQKRHVTQSVKYYSDIT